MLIKAFKTRKLIPPKDDLISAIKESISEIPEKSIVAITSKVVSIWQGRCVHADSVEDKDELVKEEADLYLPRDETPNGWVMHTIKNNHLIPTAGIDQSNGSGYFVLWPEDPMKAAQDFYERIRKECGVKDVGVVITDSHSVPSHRGTIGMAIGYFGFEPLRDYRGTPDIFMQDLNVSQSNLADGFAAAAVLVMGEGTETTPLCIISGASNIVFTDKPYKPTTPYSSFDVPADEDLYAPFLKNVKWKKGGGGYKNLSS